jgi:DNA-binding protein YbaB
MDDHSQQGERLNQMRRDLEQVSATATRADGLVTVVVGAHGQVTDIRFDPRVYRKLSSGELSQAVMRLIDQATTEVTEQTRQIMTPFLPEGLSYENALGEKGDFTTFLPKPATPTDTDGEA